MENGFIVGKWEDPDVYAAVPFGGVDSTQLMIIHKGQQIKLCRNEKSARNFIERHRKGKSVAKLPIE